MGESRSGFHAWAELPSCMIHLHEKPNPGLHRIGSSSCARLNAMVASGLPPSTGGSRPSQPCAIEVQYRIDNVGYVSHRPIGWSAANACCASGGCIGVLIRPGETALTRTPVLAHSIASALAAAFKAPLVNEAKAVGTLLIGWSTRLVVAAELIEIDLDEAHWIVPPPALCRGNSCL